MIFLTQTDFAKTINGEILDQVIRFDDTKVDGAELSAIELMKSYLSARYDVGAIFSATGNARNPLIVMYLVDIVLFDLHSIISPAKTPQLRADRYQLALDWLQRVQALKCNPDLPLPTPDPTIKDYVRFGSNLKRSNHI